MKIYDPARRKYVKRTPEEEVRQMVLRFLVGERGVPLQLLASEYPFSYNGVACRADLVVFDRELQPLLLVECKAPGVAINADVVDQMARYDRTLRVRCMMATNGSDTLFCLRDGESGRWSPVPRILDYEEMLAL